MTQRFLFFNFSKAKVLFVGPLIPLFSIMSSLGFKTRVGSFICTWWRHTCYMFLEIHLWCDTCQPLRGQYGSQADLFQVPVSRNWWGLKLGPIMLQRKNGLSTRDFFNHPILFHACYSESGFRHRYTKHNGTNIIWKSMGLLRSDLCQEH